MIDEENYIHLAESRKTLEAGGFKSSISFSKDTDLAVSGFQKLYRFGENELPPSQEITVIAPGHCLYVAIPLVGGLDLPNLRDSPIAAVGEIFTIKLLQNQELVLQNPFDEDKVNFLEIFLATDLLEYNDEFLLENFQTKNEPNKLKSILGGVSAEILTGTFDHRSEYLLVGEEKFKAFVYVIYGSFEVNGMLLHQSDAASFLNITRLDLESLSMQSMILVYRE